ncbi:hypothetical protein F2P81_009820 [Scophthalmus maximus]|uniref:Uncharacterized protein n=1 Tax=Scophthalmus maximus TaxID=52904 RepID=A0A6A4SPA9_SCOMX|nr:hypothetical protein F2P81_009820 [Scophthalmus maximus]
MEVFVTAPRLRREPQVFPDGSAVRDVLTRNGRVEDVEDPVQHGAVYNLQPRLCGGKGGFGSMLRALGAQIEKTTNREACRDLSGRRLRDVNHEKEMADWLKKQAEREAEKEQRRLERLKRKLSEPKHQFTDPEYQQQCHDLFERLEDSVLKGLQASSSRQVTPDDVSAAKRPNCDQSETLPQKKKKKKTTTPAAAACYWTGVDELLSSEDDDEESSSSCGAVTMTTHRKQTEPEQSSSSSSSSENQGPPETRTSENQDPGTSGSEQQPLDLSSVSSIDQLTCLGLDVLKGELMSRGLKCGGSLTERAARLFSVKGLSLDQIDPALLARPGKARRK